MIDIKTKGKGAKKDRVDLRNYRMDVIFKAAPLADNFSVRSIAEKTQIKDQGESSSCGGQAFAKYIQMLSYFNRQEVVELSAKDIYQPVYLPGGGSRASDLLKRVTNWGVALEKDIPSTPTTEQFFETPQPRTNDQANAAMDYLTTNYVSFDSTKTDSIRQAIIQGNGAVIALMGNNACWQTSLVQVPAQGTTTWGHFLVLTGWQKEPNGKYNFEAVNSWSPDWGDKGFCLIPEEYFTQGNGYSEWILTELPKGYISLLKKLITLVKNAIDLLIKK